MCNNSYSIQDRITGAPIVATNACSQEPEPEVWILRPGAPGSRFERDIRTAPAKSPFTHVEAITVHSGAYHADDVLSAAMLLLVNPDAEIVRTRNPSEFEGIVVDVGEGEYDHHGARKGVDPFGVPWCGVTRLWRAGMDRVLFNGDSPVYAKAREWFFENVLHAVALQDNGEPVPPEIPHPFAWVHLALPQWTEEDPDFDAGFAQAVETAKRLLAVYIYAAENECYGAVERERLDRVGPIVEIPRGLPNWQETLAATPVMFVVFRGTPDTPWYAQACPPLDPETGKLLGMRQKCPFPKEWCGKRFQELEEVSGVKGAIFAHANPFLTGWSTKEAAIAACQETLKWNK